MNYAALMKKVEERLSKRKVGPSKAAKGLLMPGKDSIDKKQAKVGEDVIDEIAEIVFSIRQARKELLK